MGESWLLLAETQKNSDVYNSTKACFLWKAFLGKPATITFCEKEDVNSWIKLRLTVDFTTILLRQPSEELVPWEQTPEHHGIDPNTLNSGHHDCSTQAVFLCTAVKLQSRHMLAHRTQHTGPYIHPRTDIYRQTCINHLPAVIPWGWRLPSAWGAGTNRSQKLLWTHGNQHNGIDPNMLNWGPVFLCTADKLLLCWFFRSDVGWSESERICFDFILLGWYRIWVVVVFCICFLCLGVYV